MTREDLLARRDLLQQSIAGLEIQRLLGQGALLEVERMLARMAETPPTDPA